MKKVNLALMALVFSLFLMSCTADSIDEADALYEIEATEGDDGTVDDGRGTED